ncbi:MAG: hypothetical protein ACI9IV_000432, partial [Paracoccaceae bacterium]
MCGEKGHDVSENSESSVGAGVSGQGSSDVKKKIIEQSTNTVEVVKEDGLRATSHGTLHYGEEYGPEHGDDLLVEGAGHIGTSDVQPSGEGTAATTEISSLQFAQRQAGGRDVDVDQTTLAENVAGGFVGTVSVTDPDAGDSHVITVSDDRFEVVGSELRLRPGVSLDFETAEAITLEITATDSGGAQFVREITLEVADVNEGPVA